MKTGEIISEQFFEREVVQVARDLLGHRLVRFVHNQRISGIILETEAYDGMQDLACHARVGRTKRNAVMFGPAGYAYVYFTYGMHWCLNVVTGKRDYPAAVLIRAILPSEGLEFIAKNRPNVERKNWTNGPAKLTQALQINQLQNGMNICSQNHDLWIERGEDVHHSLIKTSPRIGINNTPEPWLSMPWRFYIDPFTDRSESNS